MPTYACWAETGVIPTADRETIARALTEIHHEVATAPRYFVQVIFNDLDNGSVYLAGEPADGGHVWIRADIRSGRTAEQKQQLLDRITREVGGILGIAPEHVWVYVSDIPGSNVSEYGRSLPDPGGEAEWFSSLPSDLQARLATLE